MSQHSPFLDVSVSFCLILSKWNRGREPMSIHSCLEVGHHKHSCSAQMRYIWHPVFIGVHPHGHLWKLTASTLGHPPHSLASFANLGVGYNLLLPSSVCFCCFSSLSGTMYHHVSPFFFELHPFARLTVSCLMPVKVFFKKKIVISIIYKCSYLWGLVLPQKYMMSGFFWLFCVCVFSTALWSNECCCVMWETHSQGWLSMEILKVCPTHTSVSECHPSSRVYSVHSPSTTCLWCV